MSRGGGKKKAGPLIQYIILEIVATRHLERLPALQSFWVAIFEETISDLDPHVDPPVCDSATRCRALENQLTSDTRAYEEQTVFGIQWWVLQ